MDPVLTKKIGDYLNAAPDERDIEAGALLLLKLNNNRIMYANIIRNPEKHAADVEYQLQKFYDFRVRDLTRQQVEEMEEQVEQIIQKEASLAVAAAGSFKGRRPDHDLLPDKIKKKFERNYDIIHRMRDLHTKLRGLSLRDHPCPDSERFPFLKEIIKLDKELHANWKAYDTYKLTDGEES